MDFRLLELLHYIPEEGVYYLEVCFPNKKRFLLYKDWLMLNGYELYARNIDSSNSHIIVISKEAVSIFRDTVRISKSNSDKVFTHLYNNRLIKVISK